jgi:catechol 2,3-dioxygenase-like lactoylglutathione lyase family enzyme
MRISQLFAHTVAMASLTISLHAQTPEKRPLITGVSHLCVYSSDPVKTDTFYVRDLGAVKKADPENPRGARYYFSPVQFIEVLPLPAGYTSINRLVHVAFNTSDADELRRYMAAHAVIVPANTATGSDGSRWFEVSDPEGNSVQFVQSPAHPEAIPLNPLSSHIIHVGYLVHRQEAEDTFYRAVLGFRPYWYGGKAEGAKDWVMQQVPDGTDWLEYMMVSGPETRGIPAGVTSGSLGSMDHFSLGVHNIQKTVELLYAGNRLTARNSGPRLGVDGKWQFTLFDPDGTRAEFMEFQPVVEPCCSVATAPSPTE